MLKYEIFYNIWTYIYGWITQSSSQENKPLINWPESSYALTATSPQMNAIIRNIKEVRPLKRFNNKSTPRNDSAGNAVRPPNSDTVLDNKAKVQAYIASCPTINTHSKTKAKPKTNIDEGAGNQGNQLENQETVSQLIRKRLTVKNIISTIPSGVLASRFVLESTSEDRVENKEEKLGGRIRRSCNISDLDKFGKINCLGSGQDTMIFSKNKIDFSNRTKTMHSKFDRKVSYLDTISESKVHDFGMVSAQDGTEFEDQVSEHVLNMRFVKQLKHTGDGPQFHSMKTSPMTDQLSSTQSCKQVVTDTTVRSCMCIERNIHTRMDGPLSGPIMTADDAGVDLISGDFSSICRKYSIRKEYSRSTDFKPYSTAMSIREDHTTRCDSHQANTATSSQRCSKSKENPERTIMIQNPSMHSGYSHVISVNQLNQDEDKSRRRTQRNPLVVTQNEKSVRLPSMYNTPDGYPTADIQVQPKPSTKLVSPNSKLKKAVEQSSDEILQGKHAPSNSVCLCRHVGDYPPTRRPTLDSNINFKDKGYRYVLSPKKITYINRDSPSSFISEESGSSKDKFIHGIQTQKCQQMKGKQVENFTDKVGKFEDYHHNNIRLSDYGLHSSSHLSLVDDQKQTWNHLENTGAIVEIPFNNSKYYKMSAHDRVNKFTAAKENEDINRIALDDPGVCRRHVAICDLENEQSNRRRYNQMEILSQHNRYPFPVVRTTSPRMFKPTLVNNVSTWYSDVDNGHTTRHVRNMFYPAMGKQVNKTGSNDSVVLSCYEKYTKLKKRIHDYHQGEPEMVIQHGTFPKKRKHAMSPTYHSRQRKKKHNKALTDIINRNFDNYANQTGSDVSTTSLFVEQTEKRRKKRRKKQEYKHRNKTSNREASQQQDLSESDKTYEKTYRKESRQSQSSKIMDIGFNQLSHITDSRKYRKSSTFASCNENFKSSTCDRHKEDVEQSKKTSVEIFQKCAVHRSTKRPQDHRQHKHLKSKQKYKMDTHIKYNSPEPVINISKPRNSTLNPKSSAFAHMPVFRNKHESINILLHLKSPTQKNFIEKHALGSVRNDVTDSVTSKSRPRNHEKRFLQKPKHKSKIPKQKTNKTFLWKDVISLSENQNASPIIFSERKKSKGVIGRYTKDQQTSPGLHETTHRPYQVGSVLTSRKENPDRVNFNKQRNNMKGDVSFVNDVSKDQEFSIVLDDLSTNELISAATFSHFHKEKNNRQDVIRKTTIEDFARNGSNKRNITNQSSNKSRIPDTIVKHISKLNEHQEAVTKNNSISLFEDNNRYHASSKRNVASLNKTSQIKLSEVHRTHYNKLGHGDSETHTHNVNNKRVNNSENTTQDSTKCCISNNKVKSRHQKRTQYLLNDGYTEEVGSFQGRSIASNKDGVQIYRNYCTPTMTEEHAKTSTDMCTTYTRDPIQESTEKYTKMYMNDPSKISKQGSVTKLSEIQAKKSRKDRTRIPTYTPRTGKRRQNHKILENIPCTENTKITYSENNVGHSTQQSAIKNKQNETKSINNRTQSSSYPETLIQELINEKVNPQNAISKRYNKNADYISNYKQEQNSDDVSVNESNKLSKSASKSVMKSRNLTPKDTVTNINLSESGYFKRQENLTSYNLKDSTRFKKNSSLRNHRHQRKQAQDDDGYTINAIHKKDELLKSQNCTDCTVEMKSHRLVPGDNDLPKSAKERSTRGHCVGENVSTSLKKRRRRYEDICSDIHNIKDATGQENVAPHSCDASDFSQTSLQADFVQQKLQDYSAIERGQLTSLKQSEVINGRQKLSTKSNKAITPKQIGPITTHDMLIPHTSSVLTTSQVNKSLTPSPMLSYLHTKVKRHRRGSNQFSERKYKSPSYRQMTSSCHRQQKVERFLTKQNEEITSSRLASSVSKISNIINNDSFKKNNTHNQSKVSEITDSTCREKSTQTVVNVNKYRARRISHDAASCSLIRKTHPMSVSSSSNDPNRVMYSNNFSRRNDSSISSNNMHQKSGTCDILGKSNRLQEILVQKMFAFCAGDNKYDVRKNALDQQSTYNMREGLLIPTVSRIRPSHAGIPDIKSLGEISQTKAMSDDTTNVDAWLNQISREITKSTHKSESIPDYSCEAVNIENNKGTEISVSKLVRMDIPESTSKQTVVKNCGMLGYNDLTDVKNPQMIVRKEKQDIDSDLQTFADSNFDETTDYRLPDTLPGKIGGSTDASSNDNIVVAKHNHLSNDSTDILKMTHSDRKSTPSLNIDELREKYLREMAARGLDKGQTNIGNYVDNDQKCDVLSSGSSNHQRALASGTTIIRSASSEYLMQPFVESQHSLSALERQLSPSMCCNSNVGMKPKQENMEDYEKLHSSVTNIISGATNKFTKSSYVARGRTRDIVSIISSSGQDNEQMSMKTHRSHIAVLNSDSSKSKQRDAREIRDKGANFLYSEVSLNQSSVSASAMAGNFVSLNNKIQADVKQHSNKLLKRSTDVHHKEQSDIINDVSKSNSHCSTSANIPVLDLSELISQTVPWSEVNQTRNTSYAVVSAQSQNIHTNLRETESNPAALVNSTGKGVSNIVKTRVSRIPTFKRDRVTSGRRRRSDTQCISRTGVILNENLEAENTYQFRSSTYNKLNTISTQKQFISKTDQERQKTEGPNTTISGKREQKANTVAISPSSSTDVVVSCFDRSIVQENVQRVPGKEIVMNIYDKRKFESNDTALNHPLGFHGDITSLSNSPDKLINKAILGELTDATVPATPIKTSKCNENMSLLNDKSKQPINRLRRLRPHSKSFYQKARKNPTQNVGLTTTTTVSKDEQPFWETKLEKKPLQVGPAANTTKICHSLFGRNIIKCNHSTDLGYKAGLGDNSTSQKDSCKNGIISKELDTKTPTIHVKQLKMIDLKDQKEELKVTTDLHLTPSRPKRTVMGITKNRKYVNSALMYNMKKQNTILPYAQTSNIKQCQVTTDDPALGTNNSAQLNNLDLRKNIKSANMHVSGFSVRMAGANAACNQGNNLFQSSTTKTSRDSTAYLKPDQNAIYFKSTHEQLRETTQIPNSKPELFSGISEKKFTQQKTNLLNEKSIVSNCGFRQNAVSDVSFCNHNPVSINPDHSRNILQDEQSNRSQREEEETEEDENVEDDHNRSKCPETYHTNVAMFVGSNSCKVNFDWYKPSATLTAQTSENGQGQMNENSTTAENDHAGGVFLGQTAGPNLHLSGFFGNSHERSHISNNSSNYPGQEHSLTVFQPSQNSSSSRTCQEPTRQPAIDLRQLPLSICNHSNIGRSVGEAYEYRNPLTGMSVVEPNSNVSRDVVLSRPRNSLLYGSKKHVFSNFYTTRNLHTSDADRQIVDSKHSIPNIVRSTTRRHKEPTNHLLDVPTTGANLSNLNILYENLQQQYDKANAVFHSNWVLANHNNSLSTLTAIPDQYDSSTIRVTNNCQNQPLLYQNYSETNDKFNRKVCLPYHTTATSNPIINQHRSHASFNQSGKQAINNPREKPIFDQAKIQQKHFTGSSNFVLAGSHNRATTNEQNACLKFSNVHPTPQSICPTFDMNTSIWPNQYHHFRVTNPQIQNPHQGVLPNFSFQQNLRTSRRESEMGRDSQQ